MPFHSATHRFAFRVQAPSLLHHVGATPDSVQRRDLNSLSWSTTAVHVVAVVYEQDIPLKHCDGPLDAAISKKISVAMFGLGSIAHAWRAHRRKHTFVLPDTRSGSPLIASDRRFAKKLPEAVSSAKHTRSPLTGQLLLVSDLAMAWTACAVAGQKQLLEN